jgi:hypothetical protein
MVFLTGMVRIIMVTYFLDHWEDDKIKLKNYIEINNYYYLLSGFWSLEDFRMTFFLKSPIFFVINLILISVRDKEFGTEFDHKEQISILASIATICVASYIRNLELT